MEDRTEEYYRRRDRKRARNRKRRKRNLILRTIIFFIIIIGAIGGTFLVKRYGPSKEKADLNAYYGIEQEDQLALIVDNEIMEEKGIVIDGVAYAEYTVVRDYLNSRFYLDVNENVMLYTLPTGTIRVDVGMNEYTFQKQKVAVDYPILKMNGHTAYIALEFVQQYTNIDFQVYQNPNRAMIVSAWGETTVATVKKNTQVRYRAGVKSPILTEVSKKDTVTVLENEGNWKKVRTEDGFIGYVKKNCLKDEKKTTISREFEEQIYSNISKEGTINLAWHVIGGRAGNDTVLSTIADTKGLTTLSPTWFTVADTDGNLNSYASAQYVNYAHQSDIEVWALIRDFDGGIDSYDETYELLSHTTSRERLINQLIAKALQTGIDGINVDFEKVSKECGEHYIQFLRELSVMCRQNSLILSVDNPVPQPYNEHYNLEEQGKVVDYVILMGYDEHHSGSYESGPVASYQFVKDGVETALEVVPSEKLINAVPFYTRLWKEVPKSEEQLQEEAGTEAGEYSTEVTSQAYGMSEIEMVIQTAKAKIQTDEETQQNYAEWKSGDAKYRVWLEDETALEAKLKLMKEKNLAGVAAWRLGFEKSSTWDLILKYVN